MMRIPVSNPRVFRIFMDALVILLMLTVVRRAFSVPWSDTLNQWFTVLATVALICIRFGGLIWTRYSEKCQLFFQRRKVPQFAVGSIRAWAGPIGQFALWRQARVGSYQRFAFKDFHRLPVMTSIQHELRKILLTGIGPDGWGLGRMNALPSGTSSHFHPLRCATSVQDSPKPGRSRIIFAPESSYS